MRRSTLLIAAIAILSTSCTLLASLVSPSYASGNTTSGTQHPETMAGAAFMPMRQTLIATEERGTGLYGYLNERGVWAIKPVFRYAKAFDEEIGVAVVQIHNYRWGAINALGQTVINFSFDSQYDVDSAIRSIRKGRYCGIDLWEMEDTETGLWGYLNYYGNWQIAPQFDYAKSMSSDGFAIVQFKDKRWGAIDRTGRVVVQPNFTSQYDAEKALNALIRR